MLDITKRKIAGDLLSSEEQPGPKKPNVVKPFFHSGSSFQPWKPSFAQGDNNINIEKSTPDHFEKNPINGDGTTSKDDGDEKATRSDEVQTDKAVRSACNPQLDMDPKKLKRILSNRASARRSRLKKIEYVADLEKKEKSYKSMIAIQKPQIATYENKKRELLFEHHSLKLQMAVREKERILKEVEIEKNKAEVNRLSELYKKLTFGQFICLNSNQAQNEAAETSRMQK